MSKVGLKPFWNFRTLLLSGDATHQLAVNTGNGNLVVSATDFVFAARIPAVLLRTYNSSASTAAHPSSLGTGGWRMGWDEAMDPYSAANLKYTDPSGTEYLYTYDSGSWSAPPGMFSQLTYAGGELLLTAPDGFVRAFDGTTGFLKEYRDPNGNKLFFKYASASSRELVSIVALTGALDVTLLNHFVYSAGKLTQCGVTSATAPDVVFYYYYDGTVLTSAKDPEAQMWEYGYTSDMLTSIADPRGFVGSYSTGIAYDVEDRVEALTDQRDHTPPYQIEFRYEVDPGHAVTEVEDRNGHITTITHDDTFLWPTQIELPDETTIQLAWNGTTGLLENVIDQNGNRTAYLYNAAGLVTHLHQYTDATNYLDTRFQYGANNNLEQVISPMLLTTTLDYGEFPERRNPVSLTRPEGDVTHFTYNDNGDLTAVVDPVGQQTAYEYDELYGVCTAASRFAQGPDGREQELRTEYTYEDTNPLWLVQVTNPCGLKVRYVRDGIGRCQQEQQIDLDDPAKSLAYVYVYDRCGNVTSVTDPNGSTMVYAYNRINLLESVTPPLTTDAPNYEYGYDGEENLTSYLQRLESGTSTEFVTTYSYDDRNRITTITQPLVDVDDGSGIVQRSPIWTFAYDAVGNLLERREPANINSDTTPVRKNIVTSYQYDVLNRLHIERGPEYLDDDDPPPDPPAEFVQQLRYEYDDDGRLIELIGTYLPEPDPIEERKYTYSYDDNGRLLSVSDPLAGVTQYSYFANDQLASVTLPRQAAEIPPRPAAPMLTMARAGCCPLPMPATAARATAISRMAEWRWLSMPAVRAPITATTGSAELFAWTTASGRTRPTSTRRRVTGCSASPDRPASAPATSSTREGGSPSVRASSLTASLSRC